MKYAFDLDATLVEGLPSERIFEAKGIPHMIELCNRLYDEGHEITIYTARGMKRLKGQAHLIPTEYYEKTKKQLDECGVKYHYIVFGKIEYDVFIDDKAYNINDISSIKF